MPDAKLLLGRQTRVRAYLSVDIPHMSQETILLVEDEPAVRQLFATALSRAGYTVFEARNGEEAVKVFDEHAAAIDLLLTDMRMPYMGGAELAQQLRGRKETLKMICISGYGGSAASGRLGRFPREAVLAGRDAEEGSGSPGQKLDSRSVFLTVRVVRRLQCRSSLSLSRS